MVAAVARSGGSVGRKKPSGARSRGKEERRKGKRIEVGPYVE
jgi:hypothetical protein